MKKNFWENKKVLVTGGAGFIGSHLVEKLVKKNAQVTVLDNLQKGLRSNLDTVKEKITFIKGDCTNQKDSETACKGQDIVMNLAGRVEDIAYNKTHQATMMRENMFPQLVMIEAARKASVKRFLVVSSACVYPKDCSIPTPETEGFMDEPEVANSGYGWAKRVGELLGKLYAEEFGMEVAIVRPYNCYGPRDHFDKKNAHVIPALITRILSGENPLTVWGSGKQTRAFLYVEDLAEGMMSAIEKYAVSDAVNLGSDEEISIKNLVKKVISLTGSNTKIIFDTSKPDGSLRRNSDNKKAKEKIGFDPKITLDEGLKKTIQWYNAQQK